MGVFTFIIIIVTLVTLGEVCSKYLESWKRPTLDAPPDLGEVGRLREQVEILADRVDQLNEEQRFLTRLLESSPRGPTLPQPGESRSEGVSEPPAQERN